MIFVCNLRELPEHAERLRPQHLISLVPAADQPPTPSLLDARRHLRVEIDDIIEAASDQVLPAREHVESLLAFLDQRETGSSTLVHCLAGVSRSMAAAMIALTREFPGEEEHIARMMREAAPHANPNRLMIALADDCLGLGGRLVKAREAMGPAQPVIEGPLVSLRYSLWSVEIGRALSR